jgi:hypothetical protein
MRKGTDAPTRWILRLMPVIVFVMGCVADAVVNGAANDPRAQRFLPELCGMTVGMLTVLTFAMRRQAYLAAGAIFVFVEMIAVTLEMSMNLRVGLCAASLVTAAACFAIYLRGPWATPETVSVREHSERP